MRVFGIAKIVLLSLAFAFAMAMLASYLGWRIVAEAGGA
jgi:hypothetical protein